MTGVGVAATATGVVTGAGAIVAALQSPLPLLVISALLLMLIIPVVVVVLTAARTPDPVRHAQAAAVLDRLLLAIPGTGLTPADLPPASSEQSPTPRRRPPRRRPRSRRHQDTQRGRST